MKRYTLRALAVALLAVLCISGDAPISAQGTRTFNSPVKPFRKLAKQFNSGNDVFPTADPSPAGTPLTLTSATGRSTADGSVTIAFMAGFTPPLTITAYQWQYDNVTPSAGGWVRVAPAATGADVYEKAIDTNYCIVQFSIDPHTPFLIRTSASVTGSVYVDAPADPNNTGSTASGY